MSATIHLHTHTAWTWKPSWSELNYLHWFPSSASWSPPRVTKCKSALCTGGIRTGRFKGPLWAPRPFIHHFPDRLVGRAAASCENLICSPLCHFATLWLGPVLIHSASACVFLVGRLPAATRVREREMRPNFITRHKSSNTCKKPNAPYLANNKEW